MTQLAAHNMFLRTLNALYVQAVHIVPADERDFLSYAACLFVAMKQHHEGEEEIFFPAVEELSGVSGIMEINVSELFCAPCYTGQAAEATNVTSSHSTTHFTASWERSRNTFTIA
jgi:hypothetical protein